MEPAWIALQFVLLIAGSTLAQDPSNSFQQGFQPSSRQRFSQDNFQQPARERGPARLLSQVPSNVRKQRPIQHSQSSFQQTPSTFQQASQFQQSPPPFQQAPTTFQQPSPPFRQAPSSFQQPIQPVRAPPPPPPQPQQQFFDQPQESFQQAPPPPQPQQQVFEQSRETFRQPSNNPSSLRKTSTRLTTPEEDAEIIRQQAMNAKYSFAAGVTDGINDQQHLREEVRDGLALKGMYSYSDGYFRRTVHYEADENGYRVTNEETEPIGNGPQEDPNGRADIELHVTPGQPLTYSVTAADFVPKRQPVQQQQSQLTQFNSARRPQISRQQQAQQQAQQQQLPQESFEQQQF